MKSEREIALRAAELIWAGKCRDVSARNAKGEPVMYWDPSAVCFCMIGAIGAALTPDYPGELPNSRLANACVALTEKLELFLKASGKVKEGKAWIDVYSDRNDNATVAKVFLDWAETL